MSKELHLRALNYTSGLLNENSQNNIIFMKTLCIVWDFFYKDLRKIHNLLDLNKCIGEDLDNFGKNWQIYRGGRNDKEYRKWIKAFRAFKTNKNDRNTLINAIAVGLNVDKKNVQLYENATSIGGKPCVVRVDINQAYSLDKMLEVSNMIKAAGIAIEPIDYYITTSNLKTGSSSQVHTIYNIREMQIPFEQKSKNIFLGNGAQTLIRYEVNKGGKHGNN
ncbi:MAG: hypothetical protein ACRC8F_04215 [Cetobacterium sp.]